MFGALRQRYFGCSLIHSRPDCEVASIVDVAVQRVNRVRPTNETISLVLNNCLLLRT